MSFAKVVCKNIYYGHTPNITGLVTGPAVLQKRDCATSTRSLEFVDTRARATASPRKQATPVTSTSPSTPFDPYIPTASSTLSTTAGPAVTPGAKASADIAAQIASQAQKHFQGAKVFGIQKGVPSSNTSIAQSIAGVNKLGEQKKSAKKPIEKPSQAVIVKETVPYRPSNTSGRQSRQSSRALSQVATMGDRSSFRDRITQWGSGENEIPGEISGLNRTRLAAFNKGLAFTRAERQTLGIHGLLPPRIKTLDEQVEHCLKSIERLDDNLNKYTFLISLLDRHEKIFFRLVSENVEKMMPIIYTPVVGLACQKWSLIYYKPRGMFITIHDMGHIYELLKNWPEKDVRAICVTDGERILGLGDLGANGHGIPIGKLCLYTALASIKPHQLLPITLDVGTNTQSILDDPLYMGIHQKRLSGPKYDAFIDEFMCAVVQRWGQNCLIQFEDFGNANAFRLIEKYREKYCTFNDDIQGTASVAVAGIFASIRITEIKLSENTIVFQGAGEASIGIAELCVKAMKAEGVSEEDARKKIWMVDSKGLIVKDRLEGGITGHKILFAQNHPPIRSLVHVVKKVKPTILIGASAQGGAFTTEIIREMALNNRRPVIFALSNPTIKAECTAEEAYTYTEGRAIFASGSPFPPFTYNGKTLTPGQGNNAYIFPGIALGIITVGISTIPEEIFLVAAESLANLVSDSDIECGRLYPPLSIIQNVCFRIGCDVAAYAYKAGLATVKPQPEDLETFIKAQMYNTSYTPALPTVFDYPANTR